VDGARQGIAAERAPFAEVCLQLGRPTLYPCPVNLIACLLSFAFGAGIAWMYLSGRRSALTERMNAAAAENTRLGTELEAQKSALAELAAAKERAVAELAAERGSSEARLSELRAAHDRLRSEFAELSTAALRSNREDFLALAKQSFSQLQAESAGDLSSRQQAIDALVKPLKESLDKVDQKITELEQRRERAYGDLGRQLESLNSAQQRMQTETTKLSSALSSTRTAGTWGEVQLRRVVELSGMVEHCDFAEQQGISDEGGRSRPDLVVSLPGGQKIVVDAKAPTEAFREAAAEPDPQKRMERLKDHAQKVRGHIDALSSREYWAKIQPSPEYVVLFLPGDSFLSAAIESDPSIMDRAISQRVLLATPMTLVALLKAAYYGWRQEAVSRSAEEVSKLGRDLYTRVAIFTEHMGGAAKGLTTAVKNFNAAVGSFEQNIIPSARRFADLGARGTREIADPERVEIEVRDVSKRS